MLRGCVVSVVLLLSVGVSAAQPDHKTVVGTWQLTSRVDRDSAGNVLEEPSLGTNPIGYLVYDAFGNVFVQIMARHRSLARVDITSPADTDNNSQVGGYDAYFGRYVIDSLRGTVTHQLEGAISQTDVGRKLTRRLNVQGDTLTIQFEPGAKGSTRTRTLIWHRVTR